MLTNRGEVRHLWARRHSYGKTQDGEYASNLIGGYAGN